MSIDGQCSVHGFMVAVCLSHFRGCGRALASPTRQGTACSYVLRRKRMQLSRLWVLLLFRKYERKDGCVICMNSLDWRFEKKCELVLL